MSEHAIIDDFGVLTEPATLKIERLLPGPIERCWAYLTDSDLRRKWLAACAMEMREDTSFEFVWRNNELTDPPGKRPDGATDEHRMKCRITRLDPPRSLAITWGEKGAVSFDLTPVGDEVLLTIIHRRLPDRATMLNVAAGWHTHLDILEARARNREPEPFWDSWSRRKEQYGRRISA